MEIGTHHLCIRPHKVVAPRHTPTRKANSKVATIFNWLLWSPCQACTVARDSVNCLLIAKESTKNSISMTSERVRPEIFDRVETKQSRSHIF